MNVNELASSVYGNYQTNINKSSLAKMQAAQSADTASFSDLLTSMITEGETDVDKIREEISSLSDSLLDKSTDTDSDSVKVLDLLTDAEKAKEYLSSSSGRNLLLAMAQREISSIVTGSDS